MVHKAFVVVGVLTLAAFPSAPLPVLAQSDPPLLCIALARSEVGAGADVSASLRDAMVGSLKAINANAVALDTGDDFGSLMESTQRGCAFIVITRVQTHGGGGGLMSKFSNLKPKSGGSPDAGAGPAPQTGSAAPPATLAATEQAFVKRGDTLSVEYRMMPGKDPRPMKSGKVEGKAQADGDDVLGPLVAQLSATIANAAANAPPDKRMAPKAQSDASTKGSSNNSRGGSGTLPPPNGGLPPNMDCEQMAAMSRGVLTVESCKQMMGAQQTYTAALNDPRASKPGDDKMTCDQIAAELKEQPFTPPDQAKLAQAQSANTDFQNAAKKASKESTDLAAKENAEMAAASRLAWVSNYLAAKAEQKVTQEQNAANERIMKETAPTAERSISANADLIADFMKQLSENPRLAKLVYMADQKRCKLQ